MLLPCRDLLIFVVWNVLVRISLKQMNNQQGDGINSSSSSGNRILYISTHLSSSLDPCFFLLPNFFSWSLSKPSIGSTKFLSQLSACLWCPVSSALVLNIVQHRAHRIGNAWRRQTCSLPSRQIRFRGVKQYDLLYSMNRSPARACTGPVCCVLLGVSAVVWTCKFTRCSEWRLWGEFGPLIRLFITATFFGRLEAFFAFAPAILSTAKSLNW